MSRISFKAIKFLLIGLPVALLCVQPHFTEVYAAEGSASAADSVEVQKKKKGTLNKLNLLGYILNKSNRAKEVRASSNDKAIALLRAASEHYNAAKLLLDKEEFDKSNLEIQKSLQNISVAFRMVVNKEKENEVAREQYELLYSRVKNFSDLFNQLPADKIKGILDSDKMNMLIKKAESIYQKNMPKQALVPLSEAADMLEQALSDARKDETVIYALEFSTPEDEYNYELQRNDNYTLLINLILDSSPPENRRKLPLIRMLVNKNEELVIEADKKFKSGAVEDAIILLEKGNKTLVRALRLGGLTL